MITVSDSWAFTARTYFSIQHIQSAALFSRLSAAAEKRYTGSFSDDLIAENNAYVTGCIFASISFLEALINELYSDAAETPPEFKEATINKLNEEYRQALANEWQEGKIRRVRMLRKYQKALTVGMKNTFSENDPPFAEIAILVALRNALVHFNPESVVTFSDIEDLPMTEQDIEKKLKGRFDLNPLFAGATSFFPNKCLSHGCAKWAMQSSLKFADSFFERLQIEAPYEHVRAKLMPE